MSQQPVKQEGCREPERKSFAALYERVKDSPSYQKARADLQAAIIAERKKADDTEGGSCD